MAWTAPMTAVAGSVFTAAAFNTFVRDNLNETAPAKATRPGSHFTTSATGQIAERTPVAGADLSVTGTTTSTSFTDPDPPGTIGPSITAVTGSCAFVYVSASISNSGTGSARAAYEVSGASSIAPADNRGIGIASAAGSTVVASGVHFHTELTPGSNTFTMKFRVSSGTGSFASRRIGVIPF